MSFILQISQDPIVISVLILLTFMSFISWVIIVNKFFLIHKTGKDIQTSLITINPKPTLTTTATNTSCGSCNGTATVTASGASAPYTYLWNDPSNEITVEIFVLFTVNIF